jgi:hypothetical protein
MSSVVFVVTSNGACSVMLRDSIHELEFGLAASSLMHDFPFKEYEASVFAWAWAQILLTGRLY